MLAPPRGDEVPGLAVRPRGRRRRRLGRWWCIARPCGPGRAWSPVGGRTGAGAACAERAGGIEPPPPAASAVAGGAGRLGASTPAAVAGGAAVDGPRVYGAAPRPGPCVRKSSPSGCRRDRCPPRPGITAGEAAVSARPALPVSGLLRAGRVGYWSSPYWAASR